MEEIAQEQNCEDNFDCQCSTWRGLFQNREQNEQGAEWVWGLELLSCMTEAQRRQMAVRNMAGNVDWGQPEGDRE